MSVLHSVFRPESERVVNQARSRAKLADWRVYCTTFRGDLRSALFRIKSAGPWPRKG